VALALFSSSLDRGAHAAPDAIESFAVHADDLAFRGDACLGDINLDGAVEQADYVMFLACMGGPDGAGQAGCSLADFDGSGSVDMHDYAVFASAFMNCAPTHDGCLLHLQCDDGVHCNGAERCADGQCAAGVPPCEAALCDEASRRCVNSPCTIANPPFLPGVVVGLLPGTIANEASGLAASRSNFGVLWTHNDNWADNRVLALNIAGELLATFTVGTGAVDPEDMAIGPGPLPDEDYLYIADIGDNNNTRNDIFVKRFLEPTVLFLDLPYSATISAVDVLRFTFPTGPNAPSHKDCETILVDPWNGDIYFVTKRTTAGQVYRSAYPQSTTQTNLLEYVASVNFTWATGGSVSPDGHQIIVRRYSGQSPPAAVYTRGSGELLWEAFLRPRCNAPLAAEPQGEAVSWDALGLGYYTISEDETPGAVIPIWYFARNPN
jgi:hypothetical protein